MNRISSIIIILAISCAPALAAEKIRIAVLDFQANDVSIYAAKAISDIIGTEMAGRGDVTIVERSQVNSILSEQGFQQTGCVDSACAVQIGKMLSAKKILIGSLSRLGGVYAVNAKVVDVETGRVEYAESERCTKEDDLEPASRILAVKLVNSIAGRNYSLPERTYQAEEPRMKFATALGYTYRWWSANMMVPVIRGADIDSESVNMWSYRFNLSPSYEITDYFTLKGSVEYVYFGTDFPTTTYYSETVGHYVSQSSSYTYYANSLGLGFDLMLNYRIKAYTPFCSAGVEYYRVVYGGDGVLNTTYVQSLAVGGDDDYYIVGYYLKPDPVNVFMARINIGLLVSLSKYVDVNVYGGICMPVGTPMIDGVKISKASESENGDTSSLPLEYRNLDSALRKKAAGYTSGSSMLMIMATGEFVLRMF